MEDELINNDYLRGLKEAYRTVIGIIKENPLLSKNDVLILVERQLRLEENN
jgi:hypothetical protein